MEGIYEGWLLDNKRYAWGYAIRGSGTFYIGEFKDG